MDRELIFVYMCSAKAGWFPVDHFWVVYWEASKFLWDLWNSGVWLAVILFSACKLGIGWLLRWDIIAGFWWRGLGRSLILES